LRYTIVNFIIIIIITTTSTTTTTTKCSVILGIISKLYDALCDVNAEL